MILDTTFLIDVLRGDESVEGLLSDCPGDGPQKVSAITAMELAEGIHLADRSERERDAVRSLLSDVRTVPFSTDCAMEAGQISATLISSGQQIETADIQIAATALVHDESVITRNTTHFERIEGVSVIAY